MILLLVSAGSPFYNFCRCPSQVNYSPAKESPGLNSHIVKISKRASTTIYHHRFTNFAPFVVSPRNMAEDFFQGSADENCQVFNCPNWYVVDGSAVPAALGANVALTIAAIAKRVSELLEESPPALV